MSDAAERFREHLVQQLSFLENSCASFDAGHTGEAIRMATVMRVLLHQTAHSTSLLSHLECRDVLLLSTCPNAFSIGPFEGLTPHYFQGLVKMSLGGGGLTFGAAHGDPESERLLPAEEWWEQVVSILDPHTHLRRRDIILSAANQDGGAHVDETLNSSYARLAEDGAMGTYFVHTPEGESREALTDAHLHSLRQMAYELLNSPELRALAA